MLYYNKMSDTEEPVVSEEPVISEEPEEPEEPVVSEGSEEPAVTEVVEDVVPEEPSEPVVEAPEEHAVTEAVEDVVPEEPSEPVVEAPEEHAVTEAVEDVVPEETSASVEEATEAPSVPSTEEVIENVKGILTEPVSLSSDLEERVQVLEDNLDKLINIFKTTGYRNILNFNNINVYVKYENINERYEGYVDLLNLFITEINKIIKIDLIEKKSITFLKELEEHLQLIINITGSLGQWDKGEFN
jgi:hypothetical protein